MSRLTFPSHGRRPLAPWLKCNASVLTTATRCPLEAFYSFFLELPVPLSPYAAHGIALHEMFRKFLTSDARTKRFPYLTEDKFIGAWSGWWWAAVRPPEPQAKLRSHGYGGFSESWQPVVWENKDQPGELYGRGIKILKKFFAQYHDARHDGIKRIVERSFGTWFEGVKLTGRIDLIEFTSDGAIVTDYKPRRFSEPMRQTGIQPTFYQLAYEKFFRSHAPGRMPLIGLAIYDYGVGVKQDIPLRDGQEMGTLLQIVQEWSFYCRGVLTGVLVPPELEREFRLFNPNDMLRGDITPRLPRGDHCKYCQFVDRCRRWEHGQLPTAREEYWMKLQSRTAVAQAAQLRVPFAELPVVQRGRTAFEALSVTPAEQTTMDLF